MALSEGVMWLRRRDRVAVWYKGGICGCVPPRVMWLALKYAQLAEKLIFVHDNVG